MRTPRSLGPRPALAVALALLAVLAGRGTALAHAYIERASPADGSAMSVAPSEVRLVYTEPVDPALATLTLVGAGGRPVPGTRTEAEGRLVLVLRLPPLTEGPYTVLSRVLGADGHVTEETVSFYVGTPPPNWKASAPQATAAGSWEQSPAAVAVGAVLLLVVLGAGVALVALALRRQPRQRGE